MEFEIGRDGVLMASSLCPENDGIRIRESLTGHDGYGEVPQNA